MPQRKDALGNREAVLSAFRAMVRSDPNIVPTMSDLVRESGLGRATVYRHFPDVGSIVFAHLDDIYRTHFSAGRKALTNTQSRESLELALVDFLWSMRTVALENLAILVSPECQASSGYQKAKASLRQIILEGLAGAQPVLPTLRIQSDLLASSVEAPHMAYVDVPNLELEEFRKITLGLIRSANADLS